jgi:hypothetical protein
LPSALYSSRSSSAPSAVHALPVSPHIHPHRQCPC